MSIDATLRRAYDREADGYDAKFETQQVPKAQGLARFVSCPENARVLDVGCGTGLLRTVLCEVDPAWSRATWIGVDISAPMLRRAPGYATVQADARKLPFTKGAFDLVCSLTGVVFPEHVTPALIAAARVLKPGGVLAFSLRWDAWPPGFDGRGLQTLERIAWEKLEGDQLFVARRR